MDEILTVVITNGIALVGKATPEGLSLKLNKPRTLALINNGTQIQMSPLIGTPGEVRVDLANSLVYDVDPREEELYNLYAQVTSPKVDPNR